MIAAIDRLNDWVGRTVAWAALLMVLAQFAVVVLRYAFGIGFIGLQESVLYFHGALFLLGAGYAALHDKHVRVDVFYRNAPPRGRAVINALGALILVLPFAMAVGWLSLPYVAESWRVMETSRETSGLPFVYLQKTLILAFAGLLALQGVALFLKAINGLKAKGPDGT